MHWLYIAPLLVITFFALLGIALAAVATLGAFGALCRWLDLPEYDPWGES